MQVFLINAFLSGVFLAQANTTFSGDDVYPKTAIQDGREGVAEVSLKISATGKVTNCVITKSSGSKDFDDESCKVFLERARFSPALDLQGSPLESTVTKRVVWKLPH